MDNLTPDRRPDVELIVKKITCHLMDLAFPMNYREKIKESEMNKYPECWKVVEHDGDRETSSCWWSWNGIRKANKREFGIGYQR